MKKYYTVYKITNLINNYIYIGCHATNKLNDSYKGSGTRLKLAYKELGKENFIKEILFIFDNKEDMLSKEFELVNSEFISRTDTYNVILGGDTYLNTDYVPVKDIYNNFLLVHINDPRYLSGELIPASYNLVTVKDQNGNTLKVEKNDPRYLSGELVSNMINCVAVKDKDGNNFIVDKTNEKYLSGELVPVNTGKATVKDQNGKIFNVDTNDPRYLSGELIHINKGKKNSLETILKKSGINSSQYGKIWITNYELKENKKIIKEELDQYLNLGWIKGRKYFK